MAVNVHSPVRSLCFGAVPVANLGRSYRFYTGVFDVRLEILLNATVQGLQRGLPEIAVIQTEDLRFGLALQYQPLPEARPSVTWGIRADAGEIERIKRQLEASRTPISESQVDTLGSGTTPVIRFADPDNNAWEICAGQGAKRLAFAQVEVTDLPQAEAFYSDVLGMCVVSRADTRLVFSVGASDAFLVLRKVDEPSPRVNLTKGPHIAFEVGETTFNDLLGSLQVRERYWERETTRVPWAEQWARVCYFYDPSFNRLAMVVP